MENLAAVTSVSFAFTIFAQPLVGALSDRTRGRLGRRIPWMLGGAVVAGAFLVGLGGLASVLWIGVFWVVIQFALNAVDGPLAAVVPDRFPSRRRGVASAVIGLGTMTGGAVGTVVAAQLTGKLSLAYACLGAAVVAGAGLYAALNARREPASDLLAASAGARRPWWSFVAGFWVDPRRHPDFAWSFAGRLVLIFGYNLVYTFQLFVLTDYIRMPLAEANSLIWVLTVITFVTTLIAVAVAGWWSDRVGRRKVFLLVACGLLVVALAAPLLWPTVPAMMLFAAVKGFAFGIVLSSGAALFTEVLPGGGASAAKDLGILNVATNIPQAVSPAIAAVVISSVFGYAGLFAVAIVAVSVAALMFTRIRGVR